MEENKCHHEVFRAFFHKGHVHFTPFSPSIMPISCYLPQMPHCAGAAPLLARSNQASAIYLAKVMLDPRPHPLKEPTNKVIEVCNNYQLWHSGAFGVGNRK